MKLPKPLFNVPEKSKKSKKKQGKDSAPKGSQREQARPSRPKAPYVVGSGVVPIELQYPRPFLLSDLIDKLAKLMGQKKSDYHIMAVHNAYQGELTETSDRALADGLNRIGFCIRFVEP